MVNSVCLIITLYLFTWNLILYEIKKLFLVSKLSVKVLESQVLYDTDLNIQVK